MATPSLHATAKRHDKYWLHDGSVVLHVEDTLFRVHQSTLARVSETFRDLFSVPQPEHEAHLDGCPVVRLEGDSSEDWLHLLDAVYDSLCFVAIESQITDCCLDSTLSILRLATKYRVVAFRKKCIDLLSVHFPSDPPFDTKCLCQTRLPYTQLIKAAQVAQETNALTLLPSAYLFYVALNSEEHIFELPLSSAQKLSLYHGLVGLLQAQNHDLFPFVHTLETFQECKRGFKCRPYASCRQYLKSTNIPIWILVAMHNLAAVFDSRMCTSCSKRACHIVRAGRQKTWERLPEIFDLAKNWEERRRIQDYDSTSEP